MSAEIGKTEKAIDELELEIRGAFKIQSRIESTSESFRLVVEQMDQLAVRKKSLVQRIERLRDQQGNEVDLTESIAFIKERLAEVDRGWSKMTVAQKKRLIRRLISRLEVYHDRVGINYFLANGNEGQGQIEVESSYDHENVNGDCQNNVVPFKNKKPAISKLPVPRSRVVKIGEGSANLLETSALAISRTYGATWKKDVIDLTDLARKRWVDGMTMDSLVLHFGFGRTAVVRYLAYIRKNIGLVADPMLGHKLGRHQLGLIAPLHQPT